MIVKLLPRFLIYALISLGPDLPASLAQTTYRTVADLEEQWKNYTSFQKDELVRFCDFLFEKEHYERSVLACFRYLFLYPDDELIPTVYYRIARSYEESGNLQLAAEYYQKVQMEVGQNSSEYVSAQHRLAYIHLLSGDFEAVHELAGDTQDPYLLVFDAYAKFSELKWEEAKAGFRAARKQFGSRLYDPVLVPVIRACANVVRLPQRNSFYAALFGIFPGGGRAYLQDWVPAAGTIISVAGLAIQVMSIRRTFISTWIPASAFALIYSGSVWGALRDVEYANRQRAVRYTRRVQAKYGPENFLDFPEPDRLSLQ